jgi:hypothetical protein
LSQKSLSFCKAGVDPGFFIAVSGGFCVEATAFSEKRASADCALLVDS